MFELKLKSRSASVCVCVLLHALVSLFVGVSVCVYVSVSVSVSVSVCISGLRICISSIANTSGLRVCILCVRAPVLYVCHLQNDVRSRCSPTRETDVLFGLFRNMFWFQGGPQHHNLKLGTNNSYLCNYLLAICDPPLPPPCPCQYHIAQQHHLPQHHLATSHIDVALHWRHMIAQIKCNPGFAGSLNLVRLRQAVQPGPPARSDHPLGPTVRRLPSFFVVPPLACSDHSLTAPSRHAGPPPSIVFCCATGPLGPPCLHAGSFRFLWFRSAGPPTWLTGPFGPPACSAH
jgi:hypothetical protein